MAKPVMIPALTGIRFVAAIWVVAFHIYLFDGARLSTDHPWVNAVIGPIVSQGDLGVDLFFLLSGFVLAQNYLERLGSKRSLGGALSFVWMRFARVWPLYMVAICGGGLLLWLRWQLWGSRPDVPLSWHQFVLQVLMVQQWTAPSINTSWTGPAWSLSAEWLAYLCFPLLAALVWRLRRHTGRAVTGGLAATALLPVLVWTTTAQTQAAPYMWLGRLAGEFTCGMLLSAALSGARSPSRGSRSWQAPAVVMSIAVWLYLSDLLDAPWLGPLALALFPVLVVTIVSGDGRLHRWLGSQAMVLAGGLSFALYLVHVPLLKLVRDAVDHGALQVAPQHEVYAELVVVVVSLLIAYALFRYVEEPLRHRLRNAGRRLGAIAIPIPIPIPVPVPAAVALAERAGPGAAHAVELQARRALC